MTTLTPDQITLRLWDVSTIVLPPPDFEASDPQLIRENTNLERAMQRIMNDGSPASVQLPCVVH